MIKEILRLFFFGLLLFITTFGNAQSQQGLKAEFYDGVNFDRLVSETFVKNIDQYWNSTPPVRGIDPHRCSIRWTGKLKSDITGNYKFSARVDDGIRVWIDEQLIIDQWELNDVGIFQSEMYLLANQEYKIKVEYFNALIEGEVRLLWKMPRVEDLTWYERIFGENLSHTVIAPTYFFRPDEAETIAEELLAETIPEEPETLIEKTPEIKKPEKKKPTPPKKKIEKKEKPKPIITAKEAEKYIPKNIAFERAKVNILDSSIEELNTFAQFMFDHPRLTVMIEGHTDPVGDAEMNLELSKQRAYKIANFLVDKGINRKRIEAEGYGGSRPLVIPKKGSYYPANRRVVFILDGF